MTLIQQLPGSTSSECSFSSGNTLFKLLESQILINCQGTHGECLRPSSIHDSNRIDSFLAVSYSHSIYGGSLKRSPRCRNLTACPMQSRSASGSSLILPTEKGRPFCSRCVQVPETNEINGPGIHLPAKATLVTNLRF